MLTLLVLAPIAGMLLVLWRLGDIQTAAVRVMANTFGPLYVGGGFGVLILLRRDGDVLGSHAGAGFVVLALSLAWASDTGAYFAGRFLGKHKLYEAVSPKKTVEGALGGLAAERGQRARRALLVPPRAAARWGARRSRSWRARSDRPAISASRCSSAPSGSKTPAASSRGTAASSTGSTRCW